LIINLTSITFKKDQKSGLKIHFIVLEIDENARALLKWLAEMEGKFGPLRFNVAWPSEVIMQKTEEIQVR